MSGCLFDTLMYCSVKKICIALLLCIALVAPKMTGLLTSVLPGFSVVVLCTGTAIERVLIGPAGKPVEIETTDHSPCVATDPDHKRQPLNAQWVAMARDYRPSFVVISHPSPSQVLTYARPPQQAPPILSI